MTLSTTAGITTLDDLRAHLQWAIELEHATLPPYLCALYSLEPERNPEAVEVVGSVFAEEMLHLLLAANLLNAVGGAPVLDAPHLLPSYPHPLPHGDGSLRIGLHPFGTTGGMGAGGGGPKGLTGGPGPFSWEGGGGGGWR